MKMYRVGGSKPSASDPGVHGYKMSAQELIELHSKERAKAKAAGEDYLNIRELYWIYNLNVGQVIKVGKAQIEYERLPDEGPVTEPHRKSNAIKPPLGNHGLSALVAWVKAFKAQPGVVFDTAMRCVTEGGEVFYLDPEEIEEWADRLDADNRSFRTHGTKFSSIPELEAAKDLKSYESLVYCNCELPVLDALEQSCCFTCGNRLRPLGSKK